jgi:hypothetical protein
MCWLVVVGVVSVLPQSDHANNPTGAWRGESRCLVKQSACRDEDSLYRIAAVAHSDAKLTITANKIVDGKEVKMGTSECSFSPDTHLLKCPLPNGSTVTFELKGDSLNGTMTLADGTEWRKIALKRLPAQHTPS